MEDFKQPKVKPFNPQSDDEPQIVEPPQEPAEPPFTPPENVQQDDIETIDLDMNLDDKKSSKKGKGIKNIFSNWSKKKKITVLLLALALLLITAGLIYWFVLKPDDSSGTVTKTTVKTKKVTVKKVTSPLTGIEVKDANLAKREVTGIMIENSPDARPQSGLTEAGIVVEAIAEGGITRFLALYQESQPQYIGPVRSARPYYVDFALTYDASYAHVGGSPDALNDIKSLGVKDLDQFYNSGAYWRISERFAPHNMYTSFERLDALNASKGYKSSNFTPLERKKDVPQTPTVTSIDFTISGPLYSPHFQYDPATNSYKRSQNGEPHTDLKSGAQISPKVVLALIMDNNLMGDGSHNSYKDTGSGKVYVFQDGIVSEGTWSKADRKSALVLTDKNGLPLKLNAGQTWMSLVGSTSDVVYKP